MGTACGGTMTVMFAWGKGDSRECETSMEEWVNQEDSTLRNYFMKNWVTNQQMMRKFVIVYSLSTAFVYSRKQ